MYVVTGDTGPMRGHSSAQAALDDIVTRCRALPRSKHPRHSRKRWHIDFVRVNEDARHIVTIFAYTEVSAYVSRFPGQYEDVAYDLDSRATISLAERTAP